ncbi:MAG: IS630 family transposase [Candidatus Accumulibacter sp.]|uniref:IS630 family transposase n=2 Tax=Accumulibacter sp. TaxID=2053492 RepID=UPI002878570D|nr:IS630 family transposase [Accumulibacter sp.]MDS4048636.1 IS630 family transposase [Accumulibacter sp.]
MDYRIPGRPVFSARRMEQQWVGRESGKMVRAGRPVSDVARHLHVGWRGVGEWVAAFCGGGQKGLRAGEGAGRPPKVSPEQLRWTADAVRGRTPEQVRFAFGSWSLRLIGRLIERQLQMTLSRRTLVKVMRQLGFTAQCRLYRADRQDRTLVQRWHTEEYPALHARARARAAWIMFADEAGMRSDCHARTTWAPRGQTPVVAAGGQRVSFQMLSAIGAGGQLQFMLHQGLVNATVFRIFLGQLKLGATQPIFMVVDGHSMHEGQLVREYVASTRGMLELHFLPPDSPQFNPDEPVWENVNERVAEQEPVDTSSMRRLIQAALQRLQGLPEIVRGFFGRPECAQSVSTIIVHCWVG